MIVQLDRLDKQQHHQESGPVGHLTENMKIFYRELVEITLDFMANNMYFENSLHQQLSPAHNQNEFYADVYSNAAVTGGSNACGGNRGNTMIDTNKELGASNKCGQSRSWIVGNKIIQIKTGLFSNICTEDPCAFPGRKQRLSSNLGSLPSNSGQPNTTAIAIPSKKMHKLTTNLIATDSYESSEGSNNNSFSSTNLGSQKADTADLTIKSK